MIERPRKKPNWPPIWDMKPGTVVVLTSLTYSYWKLQFSKHQKICSYGFELFARYSKHHTVNVQNIMCTEARAWQFFVSAAKTTNKAQLLRTKTWAAAFGSSKNKGSTLCIDWVRRYGQSTKTLKSKYKNFDFTVIQPHIECIIPAFILWITCRSFFWLLPQSG